MTVEGRSPGNSLPSDDVIVVSDEALLKAETFVEAEEGATNRLMGWAGWISTAIAVMSLFPSLRGLRDRSDPGTSLYPCGIFTLVLSFLLFPLATRFRNRVRWWDVVPGIFAVGTIVYALWGGDDFTDRATLPIAGTSSSASYSSCWCWRRRGAPPGRSCPWCRCYSLPMRCSGRICRRRGRIAAMTCPVWLVTSLLRWRAFSGSRSMCQRP